MKKFLRIGCEEDSVENDGSCYFFNTNGVSHSAAAESCASRGSHLVSIGSAAEQNFLVQQIGSAGGDFWIGLEWTSGDDYSWSDDSPMSFQYWADDSTNEGGECFRMREAENYKWHDRECGNKFGYICKKKTG